MGRDAKPAPENADKLRAFEVWYLCEQNFEKTRQTLREQDPPLDLSVDTIYRWAKKYDWLNRARLRLLEIEKARTKQVVEAQVDFMNKTSNIGKVLQKRALEVLSKEQAINNPAVAIQAMEMGLKLERQALGLPEWMTEILEADDEQLERLRTRTIEEIASGRGGHADAGNEDEALPPLVPKPIS